MFHQFRRDVRAAQAHAEAALLLATEQGFPQWVAFGTMLHGWALAHQGQGEEGIAQIHQGLEPIVPPGAELGRPYFLHCSLSPWNHRGARGRAHGARGSADPADTTGERW